MGIFDSVAGAPQQQIQQQPPGILGGAASIAGAQPSPRGLQMAQQLAQNPTPQMVQQIIGMLHSSGNPEAQQFEQVLQQLGGDPGAIKQFADRMVQQLGGAQ